MSSRKNAIIYIVILTAKAMLMFAFTPPTSRFFIKSGVRLKSKWDHLVDDDDDDNFSAIRDAGGVELVNDVYARDPDNQVFWFIGKVARISDVALEACVARQYALIEEHAARLRPLELFKKDGFIEIWLAPGDSEMDVAYNRPSCRFIGPMARQIDGSERIKNSFVGFQGEVYLDGEEGLRCLRKNDGSPLKPELKVPENGSMTDEEMKQIGELLKGKDLSSFISDKEF